MADNQPDSELLRLRRQIDQLAPEAPELAAAATRLLDLMERYRRQLESPDFRATLLSRHGQPQTPRSFSSRGCGTAMLEGDEKP